MRIHLIAIGGSAMHNLAIALKKNGHDVSGSDDEIFEPSRSRLKSYGLLPERSGWFPENINDTFDVIILGMHARKDNPELLKAQELGIMIYSYPEYLYDHARDKKRIVIGGSHGKTTITAMVMHVMKFAGIDFDYLVGSKIKNFDVMVRLSNRAPFMIFEGDEYLSSPIDRRPKFHWYHPHIALLSGIAWDHINVFPTFENYKKQFSEFIRLIEKDGVLVYSKDDQLLEEIVREQSRSDLKVKGYKALSYFLEDGVTWLKTGKEPVRLKIFGSHNLMNLNGARTVCNAIGINDETFYSAIGKFEGTANRLELVEQNARFIMFKDFAHAPSKVKATISAVKQQFPGHTLVACLELHTFSSLNKAFLDQYNSSFDKADIGCVYYNPHTVEMKKLDQIEEEDIRKAFNREDLNVFTDSEKMTCWLEGQEGSDKKVYLMMSSGNFNGIDFTELAQKLNHYEDKKER